MKKSNYISLIFAATIILSGIYSCKKQLDLQPPAQLNESNSIVTIEDARSALYGAYSEFGYADNMFISALLSDEAKLGANNSGGGALEYRYQFGSDDVSAPEAIAAWGDYYRVIDQVNRTLPKITTVTATVAQEPLRAQYTAQLKALRGISFFELLQAYSKNFNAADPLGVPVSLVSNPLQQPARNTQGEVMDRINSDLAEAKAALAPVTASTFTDTLLNPVSIAAYQARIALYRKDYDAAITFASEVINSNVKQIASGNDFQNIWSDASESEVLFKIKYTNASIGGFWNAGNNILIAPSDKLVASYSPNDIRLGTYIGNNGANNFVAKFFSSSNGLGVTDAIVARISEMYLIRAEAYARKSSPDVVSGAADLNLLRSNRILSYSDEVFTSATDLSNAVLDERFKELAFEGFRYFDLKRNNLPVERLATDVASSQWQNLAVDSKYFVLPIPSDELKANPNMVQNTGY